GAYVLADAPTAELPAESAGAFSRFGIMFFDDPRAAFANIRGALRGGGRLVFACWQSLDANPWLWLPARAADPHIGVTDPAPPDVPGPFGLADPKRTEGLLEDAGFGAVSIEACALEVAAPGVTATRISRKRTVGKIPMMELG